MVLRQQYKAGEKLFVDWAGPTIPIHSRTGDQVKQAGEVIRHALDGHV